MVDPEQTELWFTNGLTYTTGPKSGHHWPINRRGRKYDDTESDHVLEGAKKANKKLHIKDMNSKVTQKFTENLNGREEDTVQNNSEMETSEL